MLRHIGIHAAVTLEYRVKYLDGGIPIEDSLTHHGDEPGQSRWGELHILGLQTIGGEAAHDLAHDPVGDLLGLSAQSHGLLEEVGQGLLAGNHVRVIGGQPESGLITRRLLLSHFGQLGAQALQVCLGDLQRRNVGFRKIAVVLGILLGAHGKGGVLVLIPAPGLLYHALSLLNQLDLPPGLILDGPGDRLERVEIFHLGAGTEVPAPGRPHG